MSQALIFNGTNALDFQDIRINVIRIPEVSHAVREAQEIWDALNPNQFDLAGFIASDDQVFLGQIKLKKFAAAVVQVGLLRRYLKNNPLPEYMIGTVNGDSPLRVALQQISFVEMVAESDAIPGERLRLVPKTDATMLAGVRLDEYAVFAKNANDTYRRFHFDTQDVSKMIDTLASEAELKRMIFVGPGTQPMATKVEMTESIDLDPSLTWFWGAADRRIAVAN
jgi:hypothetical protein